MTLHPIKARRARRSDDIMSQIAVLREIARNNPRPIEAAAARYAR